MDEAEVRRILDGALRRLAADDSHLLENDLSERGRQGRNQLVIELKKTTNREPRGCDRRRIDVFRAQLRYTYGALIECETRRNRQPAAQLTVWVS